MRRLRATLHRVRGLFRYGAVEAEINAELQAHLDGLTERNISAGMSPEEARYAARRAFGGSEQVKEKARDERRSLWVEQAWQDMYYASRALAKTPSFTITVVLTLALGIGVNAALFSVVNMVALRPLPVKEPENLVRIAGRNARGSFSSSFNHSEYSAYRDGNRTLEGLLAFTETKWPFETEAGMQSDSGGERVGPNTVSVELVSDNYFSVLGGPIQLGRAFRPEENTLGAAPVIVLSNVFWETRLNRDPDVIGATLKLGRRLVTVIGVASAEFSGQRPVPPAGWLPLAAWSSRAAHYGPGGPQAFGLIGRLKPGIGEAQAKADLDTIAAQWAADFPGENAKLSVRLERGLHFISFTRSPKATAFVGLVFLGFGLVLLIACTNVANLLLARGVSRQPEIGVRLTLGASRGRIVRQLLTENLLLCTLGGIVGLGLAVWTLQLLLPIIVSRLPMDWAMETRRLPFFKATPDLRVLVFTALLTLGATLVAGLLPALHASGARVMATIRNDSTAFGRGLTPSRLRQILVITQVAISLTLLSCAGLFVRNLFAQRKPDVGYDAHAVFGVAMLPHPAIADRNAAFRQALETVRAIPGVAASGVASPPPLSGALQARIRPVGAAGAAEERMAASFVSDGFFDAFSVALLRGRKFRELELHSASRAVIVSETLARRLWPAQEPIGRTLLISETSWGSRERPAPDGAFRECEVIGVARDIMVDAVQDDRHLLYLPFPLDARAGGPVFVRPHHASATALAEIVRAAKAGGVELQFERRHSFWVEYFLLPFYAFAIVSATLGALALGMASVGLYGLMTFAVNQRVREIGVRMALGATAPAVFWLFVRQGMRLVAIGLALGLIGGGLFALLLRKVLYAVIDAFDPMAFVAVTLIFAIIAFFACWLPSRRATKVDPMAALRAE